MKRLIRYMFIGFAAPLAVLVAAAWWVLGTSSGARWALAQVSRFTPVIVAAASIQGRIWGELRITGLQAAWPNGSARIRELRLDWAPQTLFFGRVGVRGLVIAGARIQDNRPETPSAPGLNWPATIGIPLPPVRIRDLRLEDIAYQKRAEAPVRISRARADLRLSQRELSLRGLSLDMPQGLVTGAIAAGLGRPGLQMDIAILPRKPVAGLDKFQLKADLGPAEAPAFVTGTAQATAVSRGKKLAEAGAGVTITKTSLLLINVKASRPGRRGTATGNGELAFSGEKPVLDGNLELSDMDLSKELPWLNTVSGSISIKGGTEEYQGRLSLINKGTGWKRNSIETAFRGTMNSLSLTSISGTLLEGTITGSARAGWKKTPSLEAGLSMRGVNPAAIAPEWSGEINMNLKALIALPREQQPRGTLSLRLMNSVLRGQRLTGDMQASIEKGRIDLNRIALHGAGFDVEASGELANRVNFSIRLSDLSQFRKETEGRASAKGWIGKSGGTLTGEVALRGDNITVNGIRAGLVNANARFAGRDGPFSIAVSAEEVTYKMLRAGLLALEASGALTDHTLSVSLRSPVSTITARAAGSYSEGVWNGTIAQLSGSGGKEEWKLQESASLSVSARGFSLSPLVIAGQGEERVAFQASIGAAPLSGSFSAEWRELNIARINTWISGVTVSGFTNGRISGKIFPEARVDVAADAAISRGSLVRRINDVELRAELRNAGLSLAWRDQTMHAKVSLVFAEYGAIDASLEIPLPARLPLSVNRDGQLRGWVTGEIREKGTVSFLFPGLVQESRGEIDLDIRVAGTWASPDLQGSVALKDAGAYFPAAGIHVTDIQLAAVISEGKVNIKSFSGRSDPGRIKGEATISLDGWRPEKYAGRLQGERFRALFLPELRMLVTPDIEFEGTPGNVRARGTVRVPELLIYGAPAGGPAEQSEDVVIVGAPGEDRAAPRMAMDIEIRVILGDRVIVKAGGIDAKLGGQVVVSKVSPQRVTGKGEIKVVEGKYGIYGVILDIEGGRLFFAGGPVENPTLDIQALRTVDEVKAGVVVTGTLQQPLVKLYSEPAMSDTDILSYIVLGHPAGQDREEAALLMQAAAALLSRGESVALQDQIRSRLGVDVIDIESGEGEVSRSLITVGKYLSSRLYISYGYALLSGESLFRLRYKLGKRWELESHSGETSGVDLYYTILFD